MADLDFQNYTPTQGSQQPMPVTLASAATLVPKGFLTFVSGTVVTSRIEPPMAGVHMLAMVFTDATPPTFTTSGNVLNVVVPTLNVPTLFIYDPIQRKYYGWANNLT